MLIAVSTGNVLASTAVATKAVVANCVVLVPLAAVGAVGVPVKARLAANFAAGIVLSPIHPRDCKASRNSAGEGGTVDVFPAAAITARIDWSTQ